MIQPIRCFTCGKVVAHAWKTYQDMLQDDKKSPAEALDQLGFRRYCCRRMFLSHVELVDRLLCSNPLSEPK
jgi:DNA-directed RNA polymerase subunit N (RpoN/RPB10)